MLPRQSNRYGTAFHKYKKMYIPEFKSYSLGFKEHGTKQLKGGKIIMRARNHFYFKPTRG